MNTTLPLPLQPSLATSIFTITCYFVISTLGMFSSSMTVYVIVRNKSLQSNCLIILAGGSVGSLAAALYYLVRGIDKLGLLVGSFKTQRNAVQCFILTAMWCQWGMIYQGQMTFLVAMDRLFSVLMPMTYRKLGKRYVTAMLGIPAALIIVQTTFALITAPRALWSNSLITCSGTDSVQAFIAAELFRDLNLIYAVSNIVAYAAMIACLRYRRKSLSNAAAKNDVFAKQQIAVIPTVKLLMLLYLLTSVIEEGVFFANTWWIPPGEVHFIVTAIGTALKDASTMVEAGALLIKNKKFRECFLGVFRSSSNVVSISQSNQK